jgi:transposase-like protein
VDNSVFTMPVCKKCGIETTSKSGFVGGRQRYRCKKCKYYFRVGDGRTDCYTKTNRLMSILLYTLTNCSFRNITEILDIKHSQCYKYVKQFCVQLPNPVSTKGLKDMSFEELTSYLFFSSDTGEILKQTISKNAKIFPDETVEKILNYIISKQTN